MRGNSGFHVQQQCMYNPIRDELLLFTARAVCDCEANKTIESRVRLHVFSRLHRPQISWHAHLSHCSSQFTPWRSHSALPMS